MRIVMTTVVVFLLGVQTPTAQDDAGDAAVRARIKALEAAWNARDAAGVASGYAPDGDLILGDGPRYTGRDAIGRSFTAAWSGLPADRRISISIDAIRHPGPDIAIAECTARFSAGEPTQDRGTWVMVRRQGAWWVAALRVMPAERMAPSVAWGQTADADKGAIRAAFQEWVGVAERGDADTYLSFITDDAVVMAPGQTEVVGKHAIGPWVRDFFARYTFKFSGWNSKEVVVAGDVAFHRYTGVATLTPRAGGASLRQDRKYLDVLRRGADGRWRASHHVFNLNP